MASKLEGPLYTQPKAGGSLGGEKVTGPVSKTPPDPLGLNKTSSK